MSAGTTVPAHAQQPGRTPDTAVSTHTTDRASTKAGGTGGTRRDGGLFANGGPAGAAGWAEMRGQAGRRGTPALKPAAPAAPGGTAGCLPTAGRRERRVGRRCV
ncbi:hypothetical protein [Mycobacterium tuberculosis]|uniref:hypothetical protein n=1 Tax=Mycobacterium tuberculosis TaxID=1773 RepID=UPI00272D8790|nr:hypothetical protein [Mycobacterium tuberculosis]